MAMQHAVFAYQALEGHDWDTVVRTCVRAESVGPVLMPSEFIAGSKNLRVNHKIAEAARLFVDTMGDILADLSPPEPEKVPGYGTTVSMTAEDQDPPDGDIEAITG